MSRFNMSHTLQKLSREPCDQDLKYGMTWHDSTLHHTALILHFTDTCICLIALATSLQIFLMLMGSKPTKLNEASWVQASAERLSPIALPWSAKTKPSANRLKSTISLTSRHMLTQIKHWIELQIKWLSNYEWAKSLQQTPSVFRNQSLPLVQIRHLGRQPSQHCLLSSPGQCPWTLQTSNPVPGSKRSEKRWGMTTAPAICS